jgi:energy-coupling factor transporter ATP-binding protein EcfA2
VTHDLRFAGTIAGRLVVLRRGTVVADGAAAALLVDTAALEAAGLEAPPLVRLALALGVDPALAVAGSEEALAGAIGRRAVAR